MLAIAGGIIIAGLVIAAFWMGVIAFAAGDSENSGPLKGCGCLIMLAVVAVIIFVIF